ncbi:hypothetical protein [Thermus tengchongensis]|uniref:hypothetical protein n=1 Tax=Thermus tengchongensis TaxID=1214928 RepID=UPI001F19D324|nr:hypothetical protein [Thermus tengchongensis]
MRKVRHLEEIPEFASEEEARFWGSTAWGRSCWRGWPRRRKGFCPQPAPGRVPSPYAWTRTSCGGSKPLARRKGKGYQTLLKEFVLERLYEEEKREGVI